MVKLDVGGPSHLTYFSFSLRETSWLPGVNGIALRISPFQLQEFSLPTGPIEANYTWRMTRVPRFGTSGQSRFALAQQPAGDGFAISRGVRPEIRSIGNAE